MRKYFGIIPSWLAHNLILIRTIPNDAAASDEDADGNDVDDVADFPAVFFHISHWYLSWNTIDKSKSQESTIDDGKTTCIDPEILSRSLRISCRFFVPKIFLRVV